MTHNFVLAAMAVDGLNNLLTSGLTRNEAFAELVTDYTERVILALDHYKELTEANVNTNEFRAISRVCTDLWYDGKPAEDNYMSFLRMVGACKEIVDATLLADRQGWEVSRAIEYKRSLINA